MRFGLLKIFFLLALNLAGCATLNADNTSDISINVPSNKGLTPQELSIGECGIFIWSSGMPRTFLFFHKQGEQHARYYTYPDVITLETSQNTMMMNTQSLIQYTYSGAGFETVTFKGTLLEEQQGTQLISNAVITTKKPGSWEEIHSVAGVYVCR